MGDFPKDAAAFITAVQNLFTHHYDIFVHEHDIADDTFLISWTDRVGTKHRTWVTQAAMSELNESRTQN